MHECPDCQMSCDCDGEDHEQDAPPDCRHPCEEDPDGYNDPLDEA